MRYLPSTARPAVARPRSANRATVVSTAVVAVGGAWAISSLTRATTGVNESVPFLILTAMIALAVIHESGMNRVSLLSPFFVVSATYFIMFAAVPLADVHFDNPITHHALWSSASWLILLGYVVLYAGYRAAFALIPSSDDRDQRFTWSAGRSEFLALILLAAAMSALFLELLSIGGLSLYVLKFSERRVLIKGGVTYIKVATLAMPGILLLLGAWLSGPSRRRAVLILLALPPVLLASALGGQRWRDLTVLVAIVAAYHFGRRKIPRAVLAGLMVIVAVLFVYYGSQRSYIGTRRTAPSIVGTTNFYQNYVSHQELSQFRNFVVMLEGVPGNLPFQHGATLLSVIPGAPFPTAGFLFSSTFYASLYSGGTSIAPSLPGELYLNFGFPGIVAGMALFGLILGILEAAFRRRRNSIGVILVYAYSIIPLGGLLRGDFTTFGGYYLLGLVPLLLAIPLVGWRSQITGHPGAVGGEESLQRVRVAPARWNVAER
jgi:oligosaccharide repeat unit polymerase